MTEARTCLWLPMDACRAAAELWTGVVPGSRIEGTVELTGRGEAGDAVVIDLVIAGTRFQIMGAGRPEGHGPTMASSFTLIVADQAELDRVWYGLLADGGREMACGWLADRFGFSWQVIPQVHADAMASGRREVQQAAVEAIWQMVRIDVAAVEEAVRRVGWAPAR